MNNIRYIFTPPGVMKSATLILGLIVTCMIGHAYDRSFYNNAYKFLNAVSGVDPELPSVDLFPENMGKEGFFLSIAVICFLMSLAFFICHIMTEELSRSPGNQFFDAGYHALGALLMFIGAALVISSAVNINKFEKNLDLQPFGKGMEKFPLGQFKAGNGLGFKFQYKSEKIAAGVFGLINSIIYGLTAWLTFIGNPHPTE